MPDSRLRPGYVGPQVRVDHDISMLVPEIWCRMRVHERDPQFHDRGGTARARRGFRRSTGGRFSRAAWDTASPRCLSTAFLGRLFETPDVVFSEEMLRPEKQSLELFAAGVDAIVEAQRRVALNYFEDGSVEAACPPLKALLHIMAHGEYEGMGLDDPRFRALFNARACWKAIGIRNGCASNRNATLRCGGAIWQLSNNFSDQRR